MFQGTSKHSEETEIYDAKLIKIVTKIAGHVLANNHQVALELEKSFGYRWALSILLNYLISFRNL